MAGSCGNMEQALRLDYAGQFPAPHDKIRQKAKAALQPNPLCPPKENCASRLRATLDHAPISSGFEKIASASNTEVFPESLAPTRRLISPSLRKDTFSKPRNLPIANSSRIFAERKLFVSCTIAMAEAKNTTQAGKTRYAYGRQLRFAIKTGADQISAGNEQGLGCL